MSLFYSLARMYTPYSCTNREGFMISKTAHFACFCLCIDRTRTAMCHESRCFFSCGVAAQAYATVSLCSGSDTLDLRCTSLHFYKKNMIGKIYSKNLTFLQDQPFAEDLLTGISSKKKNKPATTGGSTSRDSFFPPLFP